MDKQEKLQMLTAYYLSNYSEKLSEQGCNDLTLSEKVLICSLFSEEELEEFEKEYQKLNKSPEAYDPEHKSILLHNSSFPWLLSKKLAGK